MGAAPVPGRKIPVKQQCHRGCALTSFFISVPRLPPFQQSSQSLRFRGANARDDAPHFRLRFGSARAFGVWLAISAPSIRVTHRSHRGFADPLRTQSHRLSPSGS
jgi:hypothetical protein